GPDQRVGVVACLLVPVAEVHAQVLAVDPEEPVVEPALPVVACDGLLMVVQLDLGNLFHGAPVRSSSHAGVSGDRRGGVILARGGGLAGLAASSAGAPGKVYPIGALPKLSFMDPLSVSLAVPRLH